MPAPVKNMKQIQLHGGTMKFGGFSPYDLCQGSDMVLKIW
jgi:hypothetical protein